MTEKGSAPASRSASPQSVTRVIRILEALCAADGPVSLAELARVLGSPKSSLAAVLRGLADEGFIVPDGAAWRLGPGAYGLGSALLEARRRLSSPQLVHEGLRRLAERSGETVLYAVRDAATDTITYVEVIESRHAVRFAVALGDRRPLYATAAGRMLLAAGPDDALRAYLDRLRPQRLTPQTETARGAIAATIAAARAAGVAQTIDQLAEGVTGTAAPVRDADGTVLGAMVIGAPASRAIGREADLRAMVTEEAASVSRSLGYRG